MSELIITERSDIVAIADAVRSKTGSNEEMTLSGIVDGINSISGFGAVIEPAEDDIPKVFITGIKPITKDDVLAEMEYVSKTNRFHSFITIKCQGTSSMSWAKKNFTIKMFSDETRKTKLKKSFKNWSHNENKYVLKANFIDHSHARNIVSARLWSEVVASRPDYDSLPVEMRNSPNKGAVDGFPVKLYYNGNYEGIYTWNIGKDDWMWGMDKDNPNHVLLCAEGNTDGVYAETTSNFRKLWDGADGNKPGWSVEVGTNSNDLKNSLNNLIQFVMDNDGDDFKNGIGNYLDIQSAIDYYIFQYEICGLDGLAHNLLLATYDGTIWRCGAYDLDSTFGLWWNGAKFVSATYACPEEYQERYSLLWERIEANFLPELKARQAELRKTVLSYPNMVTHFERFMDVIGLDLYAEDLTIYTGIPSGSTNNIKQIRNFIRDRQAYVDAEFDKMGEVEPDKPDEPDIPETVPCAGITLSASELTFTEVGTQTLIATVEPENTTDSIVWDSSNKSVAVVSGGVVTAKSSGDTIITATCGEYSASCSVNVSGVSNILAGVQLTSGCVQADGTVGESTHDAHTDFIDISDYYNKLLLIKSSGAIRPQNSRIVSYDTNGNVITGFTSSLNFDEAFNFTALQFHISSGKVVEKVRISFNDVQNVGSATVYINGVNLIDELEVEAGAYRPNDGTYNANDSGSLHYKLPVTAGEEYYISFAWGVFFLDADGKHISNKQVTLYAPCGAHVVPDGAVTMAVCANKSVAQNNALVVATMEQMEQIGYIEFPVDYVT